MVGDAGGGFNVLVAVDLEVALQELGGPDDAEKQWQEAHAAGETNAVSMLLIRNCRRDRSLAKGMIHGCNLISTVSGSSV